MLNLRLVIIGAMLALLIAALPAAAQDADPAIATLDELNAALEAAVSSGDIDTFWQQVTAGQFPPVYGDTVVFLYRGEGENVEWRGDFTGWEHDPAFVGERQDDSDLWVLEAQFPPDARLDYKIVVDETNWLLDENNPLTQAGGFGDNSELRMPGYTYPEETVAREDIAHGEISANLRLNSPALDSAVNVRVYTPADYRNLDNLPVIYVTDGQEYADPLLGSMVNVLDNLIADGAIQPVIAVFVDPREPGDSDNNRRMDYYVADEAFANFLAAELVPTIDFLYDTAPSPDQRAILGTSLGGYNAAYMGVTHPDTFHLIGMHSPSFVLDEAGRLMDAYEANADLPLEFFVSLGTVWDDIDNVTAFRQLLEAEGYPLRYVEVSQGHSWGNWRGLIDEVLMSFFPAQ